MLTNMEIVVRLLLSALLGSMIGMEREASNRPAGLRTHILVTSGSALMMQISLYMSTFSSQGDPARLAAQVVSGIGFLGAGTIIRNGSTVKGLTTAASLWVSAGIGLAIGSGYYLGAIVTTLIVYLTLRRLASMERRFFAGNYRSLQIISDNRIGLLGEIGQVLGSYHISIKDIELLSDDEIDYMDGLAEEIELKFLVKLSGQVDLESFIEDLYDIDGIKTVKFKT